MLTIKSIIDSMEEFRNSDKEYALRVVYIVVYNFYK